MHIGRIDNEFVMPYLVTIGIPVYNAESFIGRAMESALAQSFESIEFLVCDDGCTDSSMDVIESFRKSHPRGNDVIVVHQPHNMGVGEARNRIVKEARGKFLFFMDADDEISSDAIALLYAAANKYAAEIVYGSHLRIEKYDNSVREIKCCYSDKVFRDENEFALWAYRKYDGIQATIWNMLIDINVYRKNRLFHQPVNFWEDFSLTIDLPTYVSRVVLLSNVTYFYYCRQGSLSHYAKRDYIEKQEIIRTMDAVNQLKYRSLCIKDKPYFPQRMFKLMMTDFYMVGTVLRNIKIVRPAFSKKELRDVMLYPLPLSEIFKYKKWRKRNVLIYFFGVLPPFVSVFLIGFVIKHSRIIKNIWLGDIS